MLEISQIIKELVVDLVLCLLRRRLLLSLLLLGRLFLLRYDGWLLRLLRVDSNNRSCLLDKRSELWRVLVRFKSCMVWSLTQLHMPVEMSHGAC